MICKKHGKNKAKGVFVLRRKKAPASSSLMLPPPVPASSRAMFPEPWNTLDLSSLSTSANNILLTAGSPSNSSPVPSPTSPYSFITSTNSSVMTSASHSGNKCNTGASDTSQMKLCTSSAGTFAKSSHMPPFPYHSPNSNPASHLAQAIDIVRHDPELSAEDILNMVNHFLCAENKASAVACVALSDVQLRSMWILRKLKKLYAKSK
ncbi:hypothetical protein DFJ58DRAFT_733594 [Suillus subalutaceus]|uniref:uncharacterized protein n=1 Tax=Suillus subalutaceus TaxID=48586 RepID=UPI001B886F57|nr:uncharacterized protein DFJ58DRAFT_733594 [Suillus subalutaceus]KAG1838858.1 hypothetical protein DFJ58DRAFT_733594 [Suillus subalutaceus]